MNAQLRAAPPINLVVAAGINPPALGDIEGVNIRQASSDQLSTSIRGADALLVWDFAASGIAEALQQQDRLKWIHVSSTGVDHVLSRELRESDIIVTNTRGVLSETIAEYVLGLVLALAKDLPCTLQLQSDRRWQHRATARLAGSSALVVGPGSIGRSICRLLTKVGLCVDAVGRISQTADQDFGKIYAQEQLRDVIGEYDYLILAAPLTNETEGMIDARVLSSMKASARIINVARGPLIVEADLENSLRKGSIAGAALDVFDHEPLPSAHYFWGAPNTIVSPHMAVEFFGFRTALLDVFLENLQNFRNGTTLRNQVDKQHRYAREQNPLQANNRPGLHKAGIV